jgi:7-carboxy-7-deazaguanine synthase
VSGVSVDIEPMDPIRAGVRRAAKLPLVETFGPTLQGEGPAAGQLSTFVRFGGCNLSCSWCDSAYTWDASRFDLREQITSLTADELLELVPEAPIYIITGGEPLLNQRNPAWPVFLQGLKRRGAKLHVETNGTIVPNEITLAYIDVYLVSPKQAHAGEHKNTQDPALAEGWALLHLDHECHLKVVVEDADGVALAAAQAAVAGWPQHRVWVMPEGVTAEVLNGRWPEIAGAATAHRINASHRLHVLAWSDVRGH